MRNMTKILKNLTFVLALLLCFAGVIGFGTSQLSNIQTIHPVYASEDHNHENMTAWESATSLPTSGSYYLTSDVRINTTCTVSGTLNLCLNGYGIIFTGTDAT